MLWAVRYITFLLWNNEAFLGLLFGNSSIYVSKPLPLKYAWLMVLNAWCSYNRLVLIFTAWCSILYTWLNGFIRLLQQKRFNHLVDGLNRLVDGLAAW